MCCRSCQILPARHRGFQTSPVIKIRTARPCSENYGSAGCEAAAATVKKLCPTPHLPAPSFFLSVSVCWTSTLVSEDKKTARGADSIIFGRQRAAPFRSLLEHSAPANLFHRGTGMNMGSPRFLKRLLRAFRDCEGLGLREPRDFARDGEGLRDLPEILSEEARAAQ